MYMKRTMSYERRKSLKGSLYLDLESDSEAEEKKKEVVVSQPAFQRLGLVSDKSKK